MNSLVQSNDVKVQRSFDWIIRVDALQTCTSFGPG